MTREFQTTDSEEENPPERVQRAPLSAYLWRPWYARLWWVAIPAYWAGMALSSQVPLIADFYDLALAGYLNVFFFPPTALMVLGLGFAQERIGPFDWSGDYDPHERFGPERGPSGLPCYVDPLDPRSGPLWIGHKRH
ncbi:MULTISPECIES: hypothetical protein [unclassified Sphingopyxis]|uniref:hypothetical protein n=2 Tax=unclassified Sphingopyxis TaxID=2614943 RepID=UPI0009EB8393|nr:MULTISPECIES: hypothetical protein [unclassified Sphingopyxis]